MIVKKLIEKKFDTGSLPADIVSAIDTLSDLTDGTMESDSQKVNVLDRTIFDSIVAIHPDNEIIQAIKTDIEAEEKKINNDSFNTTGIDEGTVIDDYDFNPELIEFSNGGATSVLTAPNGKPSNLTPRQWHLVRTPSFKSWFGDWEKLARAKYADPAIDDVTLANISKDVSKVVDENDEPKVMYHGTTKDFSSFERTTGEFGSGIYFGSNEDATYFANVSAGHKPAGQNIISVFLNIKNPFSYRTISAKKPIPTRVKLISKGYDGVFGYTLNDTLEIVAYNPTQIKSAIVNITFDPNNPDIMFADGGEFPGKANKKEIKIITETFGQEWIPVLEKFLDDIIDLYPYEQWNRDTNWFRYKTVGASKRKDGFFYVIGEDGNLYLKHNFSLFPTKAPYSNLIKTGKAKSYTEPGVRETTHGIREGKQDAIEQAAEYLSKSNQITSSDVLIPIPNRTGGHSYANNLSKSISEKTGAIVFEGLRGAVRPSVYELKVAGKDPQEVDFGFYIDGELPDGERYFVVDNVIGTGTTMISAQKAIEEAGAHTEPLVYSVDERVTAGDGKDIEGSIWYHGTDSKFDKFDITKIKEGPSAFGLWFTDDPELAKMFGENVYRAKLSFKNPKIISFDKWDNVRERHAKDTGFFVKWKEGLMNEGYDSLYIKERISDFAGQKVRDPNTVVVFNENYIEMNHAADGKTIDKEIIGHVTTKPMTWIVKTEGKSENQEVPSETYEVISTFEQNNHTFYVTNKWYDEAKRKPLIIVDDITERYEPIKVKIIKNTIINDFQSGSSLDFHDGKIYAIGDDARHIVVLDTEFNEVDRIGLFDGQDKRIAKDVKADLETSTIIDIDGMPHILILGSGAKDNRCVGYLLSIDMEGIITDNFKYNTFVRRLKNEGGLPEVNIEGSAVVGDKFLLVSRGNRTNPDNFLITTDNFFWEKQDTASIFLTRFQLPDKDAGISEICYDKQTDILYFIATVEDTTNTIDDGKIGDSYIGCIRDFFSKMTSDTIQADEFINLTKISIEFIGHKIEGICIEEKTDGYHIINLVSDNDNDESRIFKIRVRIGAGEEFGGGGEIPERYKDMGFTKVGQKKKSTRPDKKWMVLARKGDKYKVVHGGYKGMQDYSQHHDDVRRKRFWNRMGGFDSDKANDPFSPLYWHKKFGTWDDGGEVEDGFDHLYKEHHEAWDKMQDIEDNVCEEVCDKYTKDLLDVWESELKPHFEDEEKNLFPFLNKQGKESEVKELLDEHREFESLIEEISSENNAEKIKYFCEKLKQHIKKEEDLMLEFYKDPYKEEVAEDGTEIPPVDEGGKTGTTNIELVNETQGMEAKSEGNKPAKLTPEEVRIRLTELRESEPEPQLTMLSFGGGQDSFSMLYSYIHDPEFRKKYAPKDFLVVMSDTGNEHPHTYKAVKEAEQICKKHNIHFKLITSDMGYHTPSWPDLKTNLKKNSSILSATMQSKPCTPNLKINVVDKYMYHYMCELYGFEELDNKKSWEFYREKFKTKARVLIGFAKDEEMRAVNSIRNHQFLPVWKKATMQYVYPLLEEGWNRESAQEIIKKYHPYVMPPSNCMICFYQSDQELLWLEHHHPEELNEWIEMESAKRQKTIEDMPKVREMMEAETDLENKEKLIKKLKSMEKNYGVYGTLTLPEKLKRAKEKYGHMTIEQLNEYKMSHGHCVKSSF